MGQTVGDCKIAAKDQHQESGEKQPTGFHAQLDTLNHSELLPQTGAKSTECPSLPTLTINEQQSNANAIRPTDSGVTKGNNAIQSTYEALDLNTSPADGTYPQTIAQAIRPEHSKPGIPDQAFADCGVNSVISSPTTGGDCDQNVKAVRPSDGAVTPAGNAIYSAYEMIDMDVRKYDPAAKYPVNSEQPNTNDIRPNVNANGASDRAVPPSGNAVQSVYEALDMDMTKYEPAKGCPVNPEQPNKNNFVPPDEDQRQSYIFKRMDSQPAGSATKPQ